MGMPGNETQGCWVRNKYATSVLCTHKHSLAINLVEGQFGFYLTNKDTIKS